MSEGQESKLSKSNKRGFILDSPDQMKDARVLSKRSSVNLLQILNSKIEGKSHNSWWSTNTLKQLTYYNKTRLEINLRSLANLGIIEELKISQLPGYSITKKPFHGIVPIKKDKNIRRRYIRDRYCYRLIHDYVEIVFNHRSNRTISVPAENIHLENLRLFQLILQPQSLIILQAIGKNKHPMHGNDIKNYLNSHYGLTTDDKIIEKYKLDNIRELTKHSFIDNIGARITSNHTKYNNSWTIANRDTILKNGRNLSMLYSLNFDRVLLEFNNMIGLNFKENNNSFEIKFPEFSDIQSINEDLKNNALTHGVIIDIQ